jgi:hypothetical protein
MELNLTISHLFHEMRPGDQIQLRSEKSNDVNIACVADGRIEIVVQGYRPHAAIVARLCDYPDAEGVDEIIAAEREKMNQ